ncbi:FHA domain-containing protein [Thermosynechococcus sp. HN-54]|uniref:FHA domain-containing protein n=1 Tax=Thermosynechococcus sp. HN-54 TaxID=2933959 RepID=UPI00202CF6C0|nr:FHA domain-containing protein [Thermosynechococcus sp. HN-54]URR35918.1 FHA domain-containing protein [Thermosynechococcus sp. HN-54]
MIICSECFHPNPVGAVQCEACFSPMPSMNSCPNCGAPVQADASFCGQCGFNLRRMAVSPPPMPEIIQPRATAAPTLETVASQGRLSTLSPPPPPPAHVFSPVIATIEAKLVHVQTRTELKIPTGRAVIHIGKPNDRIPPDIDVAGFPNSEIVSRIHADLRVEGDAHYIEDVGSANGTYINNIPLYPGNRHRLQSGDRIALGKGDLVTFIYERIS